MQQLEFRVVSALEKVFCETAPRVSPMVGKESILLGESYAFQIAFRAGTSEKQQRIRLLPRAKRCAAGSITVRGVDFVPAALTRFAEHDHDFLQGAKPGLYPDVLSEIDAKSPVLALNTLWRSVWVEFTPHAAAKGGTYRVTVDFFDEAGAFYGSAGTQVKVIAAPLDAQTLYYTDWFHGDCISEYYHVKSLSDRHFALMRQFIETAVRSGVNMILTPIFTPPLDTAVGGERPTIQLVGVRCENNTYTFDFTNLQRFVTLCQEAGIVYFEMSHLFTQWGACAAPKIMARVQGKMQRIFGWDTPAAGEAYKTFLCAFLPQLTAFLKSAGIAERTFFHISDEPEKEHLESYRAARAMTADYLQDFCIIDALSDYDFFKSGLVETPIPSSDHIKPFLAHHVPNLWTYYCCAQGDKVSNRFLAMSGARNRVIALQLFRYDIKGFLHWGYNYWYSQYSLKTIDPFAVTDAGYAFPAGDAFSVYPGKNGPIESIRLRVFASALCDLRAMQMLCRLTDKQTVLHIIEADIAPIAFDCAPQDEDTVLKTRIAVNDALERQLSKG
ncbi:MAG: DUF4091 domain-containing protein [Ruthenibacterium sp.]